MRRWLFTLAPTPADRVLLGLVIGILVWIAAVTAIILHTQQMGESIRVHD